MHTMNQVIFHSTMGESNSVSRGKIIQDLLQQTCNLHLTQALSTHLLTRLDSGRMLSQGGGSLLRSISPTFKIHPFKSK